MTEISPYFALEKKFVQKEISTRRLKLFDLNKLKLSNGFEIKCKSSLIFKQLFILIATSPEKKKNDS